MSKEDIRELNLKRYMAIIQMNMSGIFTTS